MGAQFALRIKQSEICHLLFFSLFVSKRQEYFLLNGLAWFFTIILFVSYFM